MIIAIALLPGWKTFLPKPMRLFILKNEVGFAYLASLFMESELALSDVASCSFPSRPEPKSACWKLKGTPVFSYTYLPDIEIRYVHVLDLAFLGDRLFTSFVAEFTNQDIFSDVKAMKIIAHGDYRENLRAINAWKLAALIEGDDGSYDHSLTDSLIQMIDAKDWVSSERIAEVLIEVASPEIETQLREILEGELDLVTRAHLRRAIEGCIFRL